MLKTILIAGIAAIAAVSPALAANPIPSDLCLQDTKFLTNALLKSVDPTEGVPDEVIAALERAVNSCEEAQPPTIATPSAIISCPGGKAWTSQASHTMTITVAGVTRAFTDSGPHKIETAFPGGAYTAHYFADGTTIDLDANDSGDGQIRVGPVVLNGNSHASATCSSTSGKVCTAHLDASYKASTFTVNGYAYRSQGC